ncbi:MAG: hypothetical protein JNL38_38335 [Myxococcales bacterium]|nr:hypothetical protein [Myxococcales bacterium]
MKRLLSFAFAGVCAVALAPLSTACSDPVSPPPRVIMESSVISGSHGKECQISSVQWLTIGGFGNPAAGTPARPVEDGQAEGAGTVKATCKVVKSGSNYDVIAEAQLTGAEGGTISIVGTFSEKAPADQPVVNIRGVFQRGDFGKFEQKDCTVDYSISPIAGVAPGRVWAKMKCPNLFRQDQNQTCEGETTFRFENCQQ